MREEVGNSESDGALIAGGNIGSDEFHSRAMHCMVDGDLTDDGSVARAPSLTVYYQPSTINHLRVIKLVVEQNGRTSWLT